MKLKNLFVVAILLLLSAVTFYFLQHALNKETSRIIDPLFDESIAIQHNIDLIIVQKAARKLTVFHKNIPIKSYKIALGFSPIGHKTQQGDGKTPEGIYYVSAKNQNSKFYRALKISYPSQADKMRSKNGKNVSLGSDIMIHGLAKPFAHLGKKHRIKDWTLGCIALSNEEIEEIYQHVKVGTKIIINP
ncbi:MAG: L,D-transpeptidase family protein [Proteobacteria bacterium]|nr:L,D-transpeptidase family protein [Pseudomonadota bacterium]